MSEAWKQFETDSAELFQGKRFWANSGERIDFEGPDVKGQCKLVKSLSLEKLTQLVEEVDTEGGKVDKLGAVCVKVRRGKGKASPGLVVMSFKSFAHYAKEPHENTAT
jgi:hypothetical protein